MKSNATIIPIPIYQSYANHPSRTVTIASLSEAQHFNLLRQIPNGSLMPEICKLDSENDSDAHFPSRLDESYQFLDRFIKGSPENTSFQLSNAKDFETSVK
ncbi:hypothetical protein TNCV_4771511 [Trichonephila clavipes]|nr:hypothetical protein TNCV_4771511 [Trichonephila clavipes]